MNTREMTCVILATGVLLLLGGVPAQAAPAADAPTVGQLQKQVDDLSNELARLKGAAGPEARNQIMQGHWGMMQDHMGYTRQMPGMSGGGCANWQMMDPSVMGPGMMGQGMMGPGMMNQGTTGCPMMGHGMGAGMEMGMGSGMMGWALPPGMTPDAYQGQMAGHMKTMRSQMAAIAAETDPAKREALMREHYNAMYQHMQTMRGMGWMWAPSGTALPDATSKGGKLVASYCSQCHAPPLPALHTRKEWVDVTTRMKAHIGETGTSAGTGVKIPTAAELDTITDYLGKHARQE